MEHIDISEHIESFNEHISIDENLRIVVSGAFGSGKTYFLNRFFDGNQSYNLIKIFPVNYSVASNEDIFELIKFDILFELLCNSKVLFDKEYFDRFLTSQVYANQNAFELLKPLIEKIPKLGKTIVAATEALIEFCKEFEKFHKNVQVDDFKKAVDYIQQIKAQMASVEEDHITELIRSSIQSLSEENKKTVLIIDDLDRIDPEHIFRILNVFSAHFDINTNENKFFFDKVILVCDIENIRAIFHTRYGSTIDFSGYIDKFYSRNIFRFDNNLKIEQFIERCVQLVKFNTTAAQVINIRSYSRQYVFLVCVLKDLLSRHYINLRKLLALKNLPFARSGEVNFLLPKNYVTRQDYPIIIVIELLIEILGNKKLLIEAINELQNFNTSLESQSYDFAGLIIPLLDIKENKSNCGEIYTFQDAERNIYFKYSLSHNREDGYFADVNPSVANYDRDSSFEFHQPNVLKYFLKLIQQLDRYRAI